MVNEGRQQLLSMTDRSSSIGVEGEIVVQSGEVQWSAVQCSAVEWSGVEWGRSDQYVYAREEERKEEEGRKGKGRVRQYLKHPISILIKFVLWLDRLWEQSVSVSCPIRLQTKACERWGSFYFST